ncbi:hypothetical protein GF325_04130 [Candidatus Bathyarchaeota archaeon]|nr:hypothetical protein [Candidatus Bathyarchaeota archaeon]
MKILENIKQQRNKNMDFDISIRKLGKIKDIFSFFRFIRKEDELGINILLESVGEHSNEMMFSFIGLKPDFLVKIAGDELVFPSIFTETGEIIKEAGRSVVSTEDDYTLPFDDAVPMKIKGLEMLREIFPISKSAMPELFPRKVFSGGLLGYVGYDIIASRVGYEPEISSQEAFPDAIFGLFTTVLAYSHTTCNLYLIETGFGKSPENGNDINRLLEGFKKQSKRQTLEGHSLTNLEDNFESLIGIDDWTAMIQDCKEHILAGDIIQAVLSRKMVTDSTVDPLDVYAGLRILNPSPYMFFLNFPGIHGGNIRIIGSSPEALITKDRDTLMTVPIAGTRRRGRDPADELKMETELLEDEKEIAEHVMLVDLARNDLSRVSIPGTVITDELIRLKKFPNVMHLTSKVHSRSLLDPFSVLESVFPAGTVSGAPKQRAMEIINQLEPESRGPYAGCVGYISFTGDMDMAISIRTLFNKNERYVAQAGAGIVADSQPRLEYIETANKLKGVLSTVAFAESMAHENGGGR